MMKHLHTQRGFTLLETVIAIAISAVIMTATATVLVFLIQQTPQRLSVLDSTDQVRLVGQRFANEVRDAQTGENGSFAIGEASDTEVVLYTPYGANSTTTVRRIRYFLSNGTLYKGIVAPSGNPPSYDLGSEVVTPVVDNVIGTSTFVYYENTFAGTSTPLTQPVNLTQVTYIQVNLSVGQQQTRGATTSFSLSAGATIRSLKTNLGN